MAVSKEPMEMVVCIIRTHRDGYMSEHMWMAVLKKPVEMAVCIIRTHRDGCMSEHMGMVLCNDTGMAVCKDIWVWLSVTNPWG